MSGTFDYDGRAALWSDTATSFVNLHPTSGGWLRSAVNAVTTTQQGGQVIEPADGRSHAALWSGSAASFIDLHPTSGYSGSGIFAMIDGYQVGSAVVTNGNQHASYWQGAANTFVDVQSDIIAALGSSYQDAWLTGAHSDGSTLYMVGIAWDGLANGQRAFLMTAAIPEPSATTLVIGAIILTFLLLRRQRATRNLDTVKCNR